MDLSVRPKNDQSFYFVGGSSDFQKSVNEKKRFPAVSALRAALYFGGLPPPFLMTLF